MNLDVETQETVDHTAEQPTLSGFGRGFEAFPSVDPSTTEQVTERLHHVYLHRVAEQPPILTGEKPTTQSASELLLVEASDGRRLLLQLEPSIHAAALRSTLLAASTVNLPIDPMLLEHPVIRIVADDSISDETSTSQTWISDLLTDGQALQETAEGVTFWQREATNSAVVHFYHVSYIATPNEPPLSDVLSASNGSSSESSETATVDDTERGETLVTPEPEHTTASYRLQPYEREDGKMDLRRRDGTPFNWIGGEEERTAVMQSLGTDRTCRVEKLDGGSFEWTIGPDGRVRFTEINLKTVVDLDTAASIISGEDISSSDSNTDGVSTEEASREAPSGDFGSEEAQIEEPDTQEPSNDLSESEDDAYEPESASITEASFDDGSSTDDDLSSDERKSSQWESADSSSDDASYDKSEPSQSESSYSADEPEQTVHGANADYPPTVAEVDAQAIIHQTLLGDTVLVVHESAKETDPAATHTQLVTGQTDAGQGLKQDVLKIPLNLPLQRERNQVSPLSQRGVRGDLRPQSSKLTEKTLTVPIEISQQIPDSRLAIELDTDDPTKHPLQKPAQPPAPDNYLVAEPAQPLKMVNGETTNVQCIEAVIQQMDISPNYVAEVTKSTSKTTTEKTETPNVQSTARRVSTHRGTESATVITTVENRQSETKRTEQTQKTTQKHQNQTDAIERSQARDHEVKAAQQERLTQTVTREKGAPATAVETKGHIAIKQEKRSQTTNGTSPISAANQKIVRSVSTTSWSASHHSEQQAKQSSAAHPATKKKVRRVVDMHRRDSVPHQTRSLPAEQRNRRHGLARQQRSLEVELPFGTRDTAKDVIEQTLLEVSRRSEYEGSSVGLRTFYHSVGRVQPQQIRPLRQTIHDLSSVPADVHVHDERVVIQLRQSGLAAAQQFAQVASRRGQLSNNTLVLPLAA